MSVSFHRGESIHIKIYYKNIYWVKIKHSTQMKNLLVYFSKPCFHITIFSDPQSSRNVILQKKKNKKDFFFFHQ